MLPPVELSPEVQAYLKDSLFHEQITEKYGAEACSVVFQHLLEYLGKPPCFTTVRINVLHSSVAEIKEQVQKIVIKQYQEKAWSPPVVDIHPVLSDTLVIPNTGPHEVQQVRHEVIVDLSCGTAVLRGADVYIQGILAASQGLKRGDKVSLYADLDRGCRKGLNKPYPGRKLFIGNGIALCSRQDVFCTKEKPSGLGILMTQPLYSAPSLSGLLREMVYPQNLPSIVCSHVLDPQPGELVLDMCAAPGGKTSHIGTLMKNTGRVVALDKSKNKLCHIADCCRLWRLSCVEVYGFDATKCVDPSAGVDGAPPYPPAVFHRILLDAPCSGLGQRPLLKNQMTLSEVRSYPPLQRKLFSKAVELLSPGGTLVYSTCTIILEENEGLVAWALKKYPELSLSEQIPYVGHPGWYHPNINQEKRRLLQRFGMVLSEEVLCNRENVFLYDRVDSDTIGFFIAKFIKCR